MPTRILLEGRPGVGKTTIVRRLAALLSTRRAVGFTTEEIRHGGIRSGFALETLEGDMRAVLAHVDFPGPPRVGRYGVDLGVMERLALPPLRSAAAEPAPGDLVLIDELGRMELACTAFQETVRSLFASDIDIVATVHAHSDPFTDALKQRPDITLVQVTRANRDALPEDLAARLEGP
ncbi:nucleoside-triphosphatase [Streptomyces ipomoeae]|uniref:nucleoside-triphosphatase n=1 Tax=Streptomyces ipomoeae TaxID=103232 RepID=UPI0011474E02|nr:nucleoside-triphosphatase [Streptomyces ipomoeae]MDX2934844.1 nucleoside-triphosphatase [Streptomyces ipomoeae]TQE20983.1 AAA family ATPase [Streptomyces ipomoeae]